MTYAPERIWFTQVDKDVVPNSVRCTEHDTKYVRADLPPTPAEAMRCPEVRALVRDGVIKGMHIALTTPIEQVPEAIEAALAAMQEPPE